MDCLIKYKEIDDIETSVANLGELPLRAAEKYGKRTALVWLSADSKNTVEVSFDDLAARVNLVAGALQSTGLQQGDRVVLAVGNRIEFIELLYGSLLLGAVPVLTNPRQGVDTLVHVLNDCGARLLVGSPKSFPHLSAAGAEASSMIRLSIDEGEPPADWEKYAEIFSGATVSNAVFQPEAESLSIQPYTSGSTGKPKGVLLTHSGQIWSAAMHARYMRDLLPDSTQLQPMSCFLAVPIFHINALFGSINPLLMLGGCVVLAETFEPAQAVTAIQQHKCDFTIGVPAMYQMLLDSAKDINATNFSEFRAIFCGSAPGALDLLTQCEDYFGVRACHVYGLTEGGPGVLAHPPGEPRGSLESCGKAEDSSIELKLIRPDGTEARNAEEGELWIRNPGLALGYHNLPDLTQAKFVDGWLKSGDLMVRDAEGWYFFKGRVDDMFVCGGENIYPLEVEKTLQSHPEVVAASVVALPHPGKSWVPAAVVQVRAGSELGAAALKDYYIEKSAAYSHPREIVFVESLPLGPTGKIDRLAVKKILNNAGSVSR
ncbi:class I adenylate-forming enzyme family protein [Haliea sp.]